MTDHTHLLPYATEREAEYINATKKHGAAYKAAQALGVSRRAVEKSIKRARARAARQGISPEHDMTKAAPDGFHVKGTSTLYGDDGTQKLQWVKTNIDHERQMEIMREAIEALKEDLPKYKPQPLLKHTNKQLCNMYTITDYHLGMYAWGEETGDDWDTNIAEQLLVDWFAAACQQSPDAEVGIFAQMGDFLHWDGLEAVTPASRHVLDADTRFQRLVRVAIRVIRACISMLLQKHKHVHVIMADANHDPASGAWLREWLDVVYEDEPRLTVDTSPTTYYCYEWGKVSLFWHHGHKRKGAKLAEILGGMFRTEIGNTEHSYAHTGHLHNDEAVETPTMRVEQHRTLAAADAYAKREGYLSKRDAKVITYHKEYGEVSRLTISPELVRGSK